MEFEFNIIDCCYINMQQLEETKNIIPSQIRRRLSCASKLALSVAITLTERNSEIIENLDYIAFGSQHGELDHTVSILDAVSEKEELSPMKFSLAVHNAAVGLYTIIQKCQLPASSIAANTDTFYMTVLDALMALKESNLQNALIVVFDQAVPDCYEPLSVLYNNPNALGLLVSFDHQDKAPNLRLKIDPHEAINNIKNSQLTPSEAFYQWYQQNQLTPTKALLQSSCKFQWQWEIN
ncbi:beta-ketoacyl synthase chain length factor [Thiotrichales bacterium 19S11-10]|nr:beta-ketoacyl synthase chain length factor [Thiotrichales bacterium 19S11-10]